MASRQELQVQQKRELEKKEETTIPARVFLPMMAEISSITPFCTLLLSTKICG